MYLKSTIVLAVALVAHSTIMSVSPDFKVSFQRSSNELAFIDYQQKLNTNGMNTLNLKANAQRSLLEQHRGVGFLEGYTTYREIYNANANLKLHQTIPPSKKSQTLQYFNDQLEYVEQMIANHPRELYWQYIEAWYEQLKYVYRGFLVRLHEEDRLDLYVGWSQFYLLSWAGDFREILGGGDRQDAANVYVRLVGDEAVVGQSNIDHYSFLLKNTKSYTFPTSNSKVGSESVAFTSRPGDLTSKDDLYLLSSKLKITRTQLYNFNQDNTNILSPKSVPYWLRINVANNLAKSLQEWVEYYWKQNSFTHSSQWILVDGSKVEQQKQSKEGVVWMVECAFEEIEVNDVTQWLFRDGFVASFNAAYQHDIIHKLDYTKYPYDYSNHPRKQIFQKLTPTITSIESMKQSLLINNNNETDANNGIAPRNDLSDKKELVGLIDCKVAGDASFWVYSGPTRSNGNFQPFDWNNWTNSYLGMPKVWNFGWVDLGLMVGGREEEGVVIDEEKVVIDEVVVSG